MSMEEDTGPEDAGTPAWVMTFADLMSLLMCFFVLLLAFSEMDAQKFKQLSGSMKEAFGVQAEIKADHIPKGTSVITQEFSPGTPQPTLLNEVRQHTIDSTKSTLEFKDEDGGPNEEEEQLKADLEKLQEELRDEIREGQLSVMRDGSRIVIRIHEQGSFRSGFAAIESAFLPTLDKIAVLAGQMAGIVQVTGHTDDLPISNSRFRSNWELSSSRAVSVAHRLIKNGNVDPLRLVVTGLAWTQPQASNDTAENRAKNRRVEINIVRSVGLKNESDAGLSEDQPDTSEVAVNTDAAQS